MTFLSTLAHAAKSLALVAARRPVAGPRRPSWSWRYEIVVETVRSQFGRDMDLDTARRNYDTFADIEDRKKRVRVETADGAGCPAEWVLPVEDTKADIAIFYLHGGGYVIGSPRSHRALMADVACATGARILGIDYRLAPEHPCPAAIEDSVRAWLWFIQTEDPKRVIMTGDSAGGGLVLATLMALRDASHPLPAGAVVLSPWADLVGPFPQGTPDYDYLTAAKLEEYASFYAGDLPLDDPRVSPVFGDFTGLPPLYITAGGQEILLSGIQRVAARAQDAGVEVTFVIEEDEIHVYPAFSEFSDTARKALTDIDAWIRPRIDASASPERN